MNDVSVRHYGATPPAAIRRVEADDGCTLAVHVLRADHRGTGAAPIVFVHALAMDGRMWADVADVLASMPSMADVGGLFAVDCRGHGASEADAPGSIEGVPAAFTTARFADDLACVLDALPAASAHVVGCSMGGTVALAFAARHPRRAASLTIIDSTAWYGPDAPDAWEARAQKALQGGMSALTEFQRARWFSPSFLDANPVLVQEAVDLFLRNRVPHYVASCRMLGAADERAGLAAYTGRVSVIVGEDDYATPPSMSQDMASRLPNATLTVIPGLRHYTPLESPSVIAGLIAELLGRVATDSVA